MFHRVKAKGGFWSSHYSLLSHGGCLQWHGSITSAACHDIASAARMALVYHTSHETTQGPRLWIAAAWVPLIKKEGILAGYTATSDTIPPYRTAWDHSMRDDSAHIKSAALSVSLGERNVGENRDGLVAITWPQDLCLLLDHNSFMNLAVGVSGICTKPRVQWGGWCGHKPQSEAHPCFLALSCYHRIPCGTNTFAGWWQDSYGNKICCPQCCALKTSYKARFFTSSSQEADNWNHIGCKCHVEATWQ